MFPVEYLGIMMSGYGIGGLIPSIINVAIIGVSTNSAKVVGVTCFCICTILHFSCIGLIFILQRTPFYVSYERLSFQMKKEHMREVSDGFNYFKSPNLYYKNRNSY